MWYSWHDVAAALQKHNRDVSDSVWCSVNLKISGWVCVCVSVYPSSMLLSGWLLSFSAVRQVKGENREIKRSIEWEKQFDRVTIVITKYRNRKQTGKQIDKVSDKHTRGLYYEAGFCLIEVTSGLTLGFPSYDTGSLLTRVNHHGNLCWTANLLRRSVCSG